MWYLKACRSCLATVGHFERIGPQARRLFSVITGLQAEGDDGFPQYFCAECYAHVKKALQFRRRSRRAHFVLKEIQAVKKQVAQSEVEKVDRVKTNLISPYSLWKPEDTIFSYTTPDAVEPPVEITPDIEAALKESLNQPVFDIQCNSDAKTIKIDIIPSEPTYLKTQSVEQNPTGELIKLQLETLKSSSILVDIKPANWREIEREEEDRRKRERQMEIDAAIHDIHADDCFDDGAVDDTEVVPEDIDMEDIFKGLKEESERESESEPELEFTDVPTTNKTKHRKSAQQSNVKKTPIPKFLRKTAVAHIANTLSKTDITYVPLDEQKAIFDALFNDVSFQSASYKCGICLTSYCTVEELAAHVVYHNEKLKFQHVCEICKDRFETMEDLVIHRGLTHWYKYGCHFCEQEHYTLESLMKCNNKDTVEDFQIMNQFTLTSLSPEQMYAPPKQWRGLWGKNKCNSCKIYFANYGTCRVHMEAHKPAPPSKIYRKCDICHLNIMGRSQKWIIKHMEHWHLYNYECKTCKKTFRSRLEAIQHLSDCVWDKVCPICNMHFTSAKSFSNHCYQAHREQCNMCNETAQNQTRLLVHQLFTHGYFRLNTVAELNDARLYCELCKIYFTEEKLLFHHLVKKKHPAADHYENGCKHCCQLFDSKEEVAKHKCPNHENQSPKQSLEYPGKCPDCDVICDTAKGLRLHRQRVHDVKCKMQLCEHCGTSVHSSYYPQHKRLQHGIKTPKPTLITCRFCPTTSAVATHHVSHVLYNHTGRPYRCNLCGARRTSRVKCREHILKTHAPVLPYECEACNRNFAHLDFLHEHCIKVHGVDLKKTDKTVYLPKRMFGKVYTYPDMKIDGSLLDLDILQQTPVEICDYLDDNNKIIDYREAFFFDPEIDQSQPTRHPPAPKINKKRTLAEHRQQYEKKKLRKLRKKMEQQNVGRESLLNSETNKMESLPENIRDNTNDMNEEILAGNSRQDDETETKEIMGQLIEKDGEYFVLVDGELYALEDDCIKNLNATGANQSVILQ
ncbi:hypothetical protein O0L34_g15799 [Tuta absoluta]|nr:hypothetical protein O0L34_g15799 [Tuta absoluta]